MWVWLCFCGGVVVFLWWCSCVFGVSVVFVVFLWWCFCGGAVVFLCFGDYVFMVARLCFCGGVVMFLW